MKKLLVLVVLAIVLVGAFFLFRNETAAPTVEDQEVSENQNQGINVGEPNPNSPSGTSELAVREFKVEGTSFAFNPMTIEVNEGERVRIVFTNKAGMHDWKLDEFNAATKVLSVVQTETVEFVADKAGTYEYYCSVGNHRQQGMAGKFVVKKVEAQ